MRKCTKSKFTSNNIALKYIKQVLIGLKREIKSQSFGRNSCIPRSSSDQISRYKMSKDVGYLTNMKNKHNLTHREQCTH